MTTTGWKTNKILEYLNELYPNPRCELNYNKDYELLIAIVLSAQTTDKRVNKVTKVLFEKYPTIAELNQAPIQDLENIIKEIGTYQKKAKFIKNITNSLIQNNYQTIPNNRDYLESLSGVGRKTANVFLANIYNEPTIAVDTHVTRVSKRLKLVKETDNVTQIEQKLMKKLPRKYWSRTHHQLVLFGRYQCKAISPHCSNCQLQTICQYYQKSIKK